MIVVSGAVRTVLFHSSTVVLLCQIGFDFFDGFFDVHSLHVLSVLLLELGVRLEGFGHDGRVVVRAEEEHAYGSLFDILTGQFFRWVNSSGPRGKPLHFGPHRVTHLWYVLNTPHEASRREGRKR